MYTAILTICFQQPLAVSSPHHHQRAQAHTNPTVGLHGHVPIAQHDAKCCYSYARGVRRGYCLCWWPRFLTMSRWRSILAQSLKITLSNEALDVPLANVELAILGERDGPAKALVSIDGWA